MDITLKKYEPQGRSVTAAKIFFSTTGLVRLNSSVIDKLELSTESDLYIQFAQDQHLINWYIKIDNTPGPIKLRVHKYKSMYFNNKQLVFDFFDSLNCSYKNQSVIIGSEPVDGWYPLITRAILKAKV